MKPDTMNHDRQPWERRLKVLEELTKARTEYIGQPSAAVAQPITRPCGCPTICATCQAMQGIAHKAIPGEPVGPAED